MSAWLDDAMARIEADFRRSADTHLIEVPLACAPDVDLYLKDESTHPSGSLKHRLARSLFLYGLCNGQIREGTTVIESSSGNTAVSEAYFARLLGLPFIAVVPDTTSQQKIYAEAHRLAAEHRGHYMDQFTYAERATDWRGNNNIAESIFAQMELERFPRPEWIVVSAGTGGTSATIGRYIRYRGYATRLCVADPEHSVFHDYYESGDATLTSARPSRIEGIGRPRVEPSFIRSVVDRMIKVPDAASFATLRFLEGVLGRRCGGSTGTNVYAALAIVSEMVAAGRGGSVVSMLCDGGERYRSTYYDEGWLEANGLDLAPWRARLPSWCQSSQ